MNPAREPKQERGRCSSHGKREVVLCVLHEEDLEVRSHEFGVTAGAIARRRDEFLAGGQVAVRSHPTDERDDEIARLCSKVGELTMEIELFRERAGRAVAGTPFAQRRPRK
jgi:hypothetical protein